MTSRAKCPLYLALALSLLPLAPLVAQISPATPAPAILTTATPLPQVEPSGPSSTPSNTPFAGIQLEARDRANLRAAPDVASELLGEIFAGERYPVLGRFFRWLQLEYRFGSAWVFEELVIIHGDSSQLPEIDLFAPAATQDTALFATLAIITQTPGGLQTATARAQFIDAPATLPPAQSSADDTNLPLPTFTFPPQYDELTDSGDTLLPSTPAPATPTGALPSEIPPIIPIALLVGLGILGLLIATIRR